MCFSKVHLSSIVTPSSTESYGFIFMTIMIKFFQRTSPVASYGKIKRLQLLAKSSFNKCNGNLIRIKMSWAAENEISIVDDTSKTTEYDNWQTNESVFKIFLNTWVYSSSIGSHIIYNTKLKKLNSKYWSLETSNAHVFSLSRSEENNYLIPPIYFIPRVINHITV